MTEQDQRGRSLPAVPDKIIVAPIANDASLLAKAGFTDKLPIAMRDLNNVLGRTDLGARLENEPAVLSYTLETNTDSPTLTRDVKYESGPKVTLQVYSQDEVYSEETKEFSSRAVLEIKKGIGYDRSITSAFLADLQDFVKRVFPNRKVMLHVPEGEDIDFNSLTDAELNELPKMGIPRRRDDTPYELKIETSGGYRTFLTMGLDIIWHYKGEVVTELDETETKEIRFIRQKRTFNIYSLVYNSRIFRTSGEDVEKLLEDFRELAVKNPYLHMYLPQERKNAEDGLVQKPETSIPPKF